MSSSSASAWATTSPTAVYWNRYDYYKPYARLDEAGQLVIDGYPLPDIKRFPGRYDSGIPAWIHDHSYLVRLVNGFVRGLGGGLERYGQKGPDDFEESDIYLQPDKPSTSPGDADQRETAGKNFSRLPGAWHSGDRAGGTDQVRAWPVLYA